MTKRTASLAVVIAAIWGCASPSPIEDPFLPPEIHPVTVIAPSLRPVAPSAIVREIALPTEMALGAPTGVAIEPDSGRRIVLMDRGALYALGTGELLWQAVAAEDPFGFTDLIALGGGRLALTSVGDGFLVELGTGSMSQHFCYEPGWMDPQGENPVQVSFALARDEIAGRLYAQPRSYQLAGFGEVTESFVATYDEAGGSDLAWWALPDVSFAATGMVVLPHASGTEPHLVLAAGTMLHRFDVATGELGAIVDLAELGVTDVAGLALDGHAETLLVLDASRRTVIEIRTSALGLDPE